MHYIRNVKRWIQFICFGSMKFHISVCPHSLTLEKTITTSILTQILAFSTVNHFFLWHFKQIGSKCAWYTHRGPQTQPHEQWKRVEWLEYLCVCVCVGFVRWWYIQSINTHGHYYMGIGGPDSCHSREYAHALTLTHSLTYLHTRAPPTRYYTNAPIHWHPI